MTRHRNSQSSKWAVRTKKRAEKMMKSILALDFLKQIIHLKDIEDTALNTVLLTYTQKQKISAVRKSSPSQRRCRQRLTDLQFRRYFCMSRDCLSQ